MNSSYPASASLRLCASLLLVATAVGAEEPLRWKWSEGDSARYLMTQKMAMKMTAGPAGEIQSNTVQQMVMNWSVDSVSPEGEAVLSQGYERIKMATDGPMGQGFEYDSASDDPPAGMGALIAPVFDALVESPMIATMLASGKITDVKMSDELSQSLDQMPGGGASAGNIVQMTKQTALEFPEGELEVGQTWEQKSEVEAPQIGKMIVTTTYTYNGPKEVDGRSLESISPKIEMSAPPSEGQPMQVDFKTRDSTGEILFDREAGRIARSTLGQTMDIVITFQGQTITNEMTQTTEMRELGPDEMAEMNAAPADASMAE